MWRVCVYGIANASAAAAAVFFYCCFELEQRKRPSIAYRSSHFARRSSHSFSSRIGRAVICPTTCRDPIHRVELNARCSHYFTLYLSHRVCVSHEFISVLFFFSSLFCHLAMNTHSLTIFLDGRVGWLTGSM